MKINKLQAKRVYLAIAIILLSLLVTILDAVIPSFNLWIHPALTFVFCIFVGFGLFGLIMGLKNSSPWYFFISAILLGIAFLYGFICSFTNLWWLGVIIVFVLWAVIALLSFVSSGSITEDIALNKDCNKKKDNTEDK